MTRPTVIVLRDVLAGEAAPPPVSFDAVHVAAWLLGGDVAALIGWGDRSDGNDRVHGVLTGLDGRLRLRFAQPEPGADRLQVQVPCPADPTCRHAWDLVESRGDLLRVLDGGTAVGDPQCDIHDHD